MTNNLITFDFEDLPIRVWNHTETGEPWWVAADVCRALDISNHRDAVGRLDEDERDAVGITDAIGREQQTILVNESGLYSLILTSRKPEAKRFKRWITHDVLPSIRKTGSYTMSAAPAQSPLETTATRFLGAIETMTAQLVASNQKLVEVLEEQRRPPRRELFSDRDLTRLLNLYRQGKSVDEIAFAMSVRKKIVANVLLAYNEPQVGEVAP